MGNNVLMAGNPEYQDYMIGEGTYGLPNIIKYGNDITLLIGKYCSIARGVTILLGGEHNKRNITTYPFIKSNNVCAKNPVKRIVIRIGNDVWIGYGAMILSGVNIGDGAIIGAGAVISKDVSPYSIVAGNPQREIGMRFTPDIIEQLCQIKWWDWDKEKITEIIDDLKSENIDNFINRFKK